MSEIFADNSAIPRLKSALDACDNLQKRIVKNIANEYTIGYARQDTDFKTYLDTTRRDLAFQKPAISANGSLKSLQKPGIEMPDLGASTGKMARSQIGGVDIEEEMVGLAENSLLFKALAQTLAMHYSLLKTTISEGRH